MKLAKHHLLIVLVAFILSRMVWTIIGVDSRASSGLATLPSRSKIAAIDIWAVWDSSYYLEIARIGYYDTACKPKVRDNRSLERIIAEATRELFAFGSSGPNPRCGLNFRKEFSTLGVMPLYAYLMRASGNLGVGFPLAGILISNLSTILTAAILYFWIGKAFSPERGLWVALFYTLFPMGFVLGGIFSEGLYNLFSIGSFYAVTTSRAYASPLLATAAAFTRINGVVNLPFIVFEYLRSKPRSLTIWYTSILIGALSLVMIPHLYFMRELTGEWFANITAHQAWNQHILSRIPTPLLDPFSFGPKLQFSAAVWYVILLSLLLTSTYLIRRRQFEFTGLIGASILNFILLSSSGATESIPRYTVFLFPLFLGIPLSLPRGMQVPVLILSFAISCFGMWYWTRQSIFLV